MKTPRLPFLLSPLLIAAVLPLAAPAQAPTAAPAPKTAMKTSMVFDWNALVPKEFPYGRRRPVFDGPSVKMDGLECHITTLNPGQISGPAHTHTDEEVTIVNEGTVEVSINDRKQTIGKGSVFYFAPADTVGIRNVGQTPATYTVIKLTVQSVPVATK